MKRTSLLIYFICFSTLSTELFSQTTVNLQAVADNTIYSDNQQNSNGNSVNFTAGRTGPNGGFALRRALLRFDLSDIPSGSLITASSLTLMMNNSRPGTDNLSLYKLLSSWGEGASAGPAFSDGQGVPAQVMDATWLCRFFDGAVSCAFSWTSPGGDFNPAASATTGVTSAPGSYVWSGGSMNADLQDWVNNPGNNFGWILRGDEVNTQTTNRFSSRTNPTAGDRPVLSITYTSVVPVTISSWKGQHVRAGVVLSWETLSEFNNAHFLIQHSQDGTNFTTISKVNGSGNSSLRKSYSTNHTSPIVGNNFYRLIQTDVNGNKRISNVILVAVKRMQKLSLSPNPVSDLMQIHLAGSPERYKIYTITGKEVQTGKITNSQIDLGKLQAGSYLIKIITATGTTETANFQKY